jgi:hypothetical protein
MNKQNNKIQKHIELAREIALNEVIRMARQIMKEHKNLKWFYLSMGSYFFDDKFGETIGTNDQTMNNNYEYNIVDKYKYFKSLNEFMLDWDNELKLSGEGIRFTATGKIETDW